MIMSLIIIENENCYEKKNFLSMGQRNRRRLLKSQLNNRMFSQNNRHKMNMDTKKYK